MEALTGPIKHTLSALPVGSETAVKTVEAVEEKVKEVVSAIPVVGKNEKVKQFMGIHDQAHSPEQQKQQEHEMTQELQEAHITPIETEQQRPQTIGERMKPVIPTSVVGMIPASVKNMMGMSTSKTGGTTIEQKQPTYLDKIAGHLEYFEKEIKAKQNGRVYARALLKGRDNIIGDLTFGSDLNTGETCLVGSVMGLPAGQHAINIHEYGDLSQGHATIGTHFNPFHSQKHGGPSDREHHLGDIGNITAGKDGSAQVDIRDLELPLVGPFSIIGRAIEIHAAGDKGTISEMGEPIAIGVIVHCAEMMNQKEVVMEAFTKPWETLRGTTD